jgi:hypothetical protein
MRLFDDERLAGFLFPFFGERGVELLIEFARRVVGDIEQLIAEGGGC